MAEQQKVTTSEHDAEQRLEQRIALAIQPVLADFERQVARIVEQQLAAGQERAAHDPEPMPSTSARTEAAREDRTDSTPHPSTAAPAESTEPGRASSSESSEHGVAPSSDSRSSAAQESSGQQDTEEGEESLLPMLRSVVQGLEAQSGEWVQSLEKSALDALFSQAVRAAIQEQLEETVHDLAEDIFSGIVTDEESRLKLQEQTDQLLQQMITELLDNLFAGPLRRDVEYHSDEMVKALRRLDFDIAIHHAQEALQALLLGVVKALGHHWGGVLKLLLKLVIEYFQDVVSSSVSETFSGAIDVVASGMEVEEKGEALQEQFKEKTEEIGEKLREASDTLRERISESSEELRTRLQDGVKGGKNRRQFGRPPGGRQLGRAPSGRPPSGKPPSGPGGRT